MVKLNMSLPAQLYRSRAGWREELGQYPMEEIGSGPLAKMVRIALSDPDEALWAYSISVAGQIFAGDAIRRIDAVD
jgi:hypothetical protein